MKVTLDLSRLLRDGAIDEAEFRKLSRLAHAETGSLAFNILVALGVVAVAGAALVQVPNVLTGIVIGAVLMGCGLVLLVAQPAWLLLANICILVAALMFGGGILILFEGSVAAFLSIAALFLVAAVLARSGLLASLAVIALSGAVGAGTGYSHASYDLVIAQPALTILVFGTLALATYLASTRVEADLERLALIAARTAVLLVNFGFWVGSLWGDRLSWFSGGEAGGVPRAFLPPSAFAAAWAVALLGVGVWGARENRRWVVNTATIFGSIHFYTQWFERLSATPLTILVAGLVTLLIALGLWMLNRPPGTPARPLPGPLRP